MSDLELTYDDIIEKIEFRKKQNFETLIKKCIHVSNDSSTSTYAVHPNIVFKLDSFFKGFPSFVNEFGKDKKYLAGVHAIGVICEALGLEIEPEESFVLFHLRDLGKFRKSEKELAKELKNIYSNYKEFTLEGVELTYALKSLMKKKFIDYRRGNLHLKPSLIIRYRTNLRSFN